MLPTFKHLSLGIVFAGMASTSSFAAEQFVSGNELYQWCENDPQQSITYIMGSFDSIMMSALTGEATRKICLDDRVVAGQLKDVVCDDLHDMPKIRHASASVIVRRALENAFPCVE